MQQEKELDLIKRDCARAGLNTEEAVRKYTAAKERGMSPLVAYRWWYNQVSYALQLTRGDFDALILRVDKRGRAKLSDDEWEMIKRQEMAFPKGTKAEVRELDPDRVFTHKIVMGTVFDGQGMILTHTVYDDPNRDPEKTVDPFLEHLEQLTTGDVITIKSAGYNETYNSITMPDGATLEEYVGDTNDKKAQIFNMLPAVDFGQRGNNLDKTLKYQGLCTGVRLQEKDGKQFLFFSLGTAEDKDLAGMSIEEQKEFMEVVDFVYYPEQGDTFPNDEDHYREQYEGKKVPFVALVYKNRDGDMKGSLYLI